MPNVRTVAAGLLWAEVPSTDMLGVQRWANPSGDFTAESHGRKSWGWGVTMSSRKVRAAGRLVGETLQLISTARLTSGEQSWAESWHQLDQPGGGVGVLPAGEILKEWLLQRQNQLGIETQRDVF